jgi:type IV secretory pathway VirB10-like protein
MSKDPFANLPPVDPEDRVELDTPVTHDHVEAVGDVTAGSPPRTLLKNAGKWAVPAMGVAIAIWLFMPADQNAPRRATAAPAEVDTARQTAETEAMMKTMREDAAKKPVVAVPVMPGSAPVSATPNQPAPTGPTTRPASTTAPTQTAGTYTPASARSPLPSGYGYTAATPMPTPVGQIDKESAEKAEKAYAAAMARQEEIRSSAIDVTKVKLLSQGNGDAAARPAALAGLQADVADAKNAEATRAQEALQERVLASMAPPKEAPKSKGPNEEFLASNAAATANGPVLTRQMAPQATTVVDEGHVIRAVLLTRVNSDLPGRILARVTSDVYDSTQRYVVIPKGSQLIGVYNNQVVVGQERVLMAMNRLILPNGSWISLSGAGAADMTGMSGVEAEVNNHFVKMLGSSLVLGASTLLLPRADTTVSTLQSMGGSASPGTAGSIFATSINDVLKSLLERNKQISPTLSLKAGDEFIFMVAHDMAMVPYQP